MVTPHTSSIRATGQHPRRRPFGNSRMAESRYRRSGRHRSGRRRSGHRRTGPHSSGAAASSPLLRSLPSRCRRPGSSPRCRRLRRPLPGSSYRKRRRGSRVRHLSAPPSRGRLRRSERTIWIQWIAPAPAAGVAALRVVFPHVNAGAGTGPAQFCGDLHRPAAGALSRRRGTRAHCAEIAGERIRRAARGMVLRPPGPDTPAAMAGVRESSVIFGAGPRTGFPAGRSGRSGGLVAALAALGAALNERR